MVYTINSVKETLPKVQIKVNGEIITANISGRRNRFATVWTKSNMDGWEFAWQTIVNSLNNGTPLNV